MAVQDEGLQSAQESSQSPDCGEIESWPAVEARDRDAEAAKLFPPDPESIQTTDPDVRLLAKLLDEIHHQTLGAANVQAMDKV
jgi:hypothetical protein